MKIARMTLTIKLDGNWSSLQLANSALPLSVTDRAIAPSVRINKKCSPGLFCTCLHKRMGVAMLKKSMRPQTMIFFFEPWRRACCVPWNTDASVGLSRRSVAEPGPQKTSHDVGGASNEQSCGVALAARCRAWMPLLPSQSAKSQS